ncbi:aTP synthase subunit alpha [Firmicutes bacterium CAG:449]|nr:aTP synthase subunit alpha [Firmicutes bacterium CAG:449]
MTIKTNEIAALIKQQIKNYAHKIESDDVGTVITVGDGIATVYGLDKAMLSELLIFPHDVYGMVMNLNEDSVGVILFGNDYLIEEGDIVKRTNRVVEVPVGDNLLGRVVNSLGQAIDGLGEIKYTKTRPVERIAPGVMTRKSVDTPLQTGIKAIDTMIPIGLGQRELIIGDRQTGKTAIAIDTIINQKDKNVLCVYVAIGQKNSTVAQIVEKLKEHDALKYTCIVSATASELAPLQYLAPYAGVSIAEEWMEQGKDVLIVYDDLSKHAVAYRTLSLLLKRSPGREAYPGDVFYLHSRLLERACRLNKENGGGSITALPIIETQAGDISAYIPTNVISITDGQIFLMSELFNSGQRPAIDSGLSVSRVGSAAQYKCIKQTSKALKIELASYNELQAFAKFGSDVDEVTKKTLKHGDILMEVLKQNQYSPMTFVQQTIEIFTAQNNFLDDLEVNEVRNFLDKIWLSLNKNHQDILLEIEDKKALSDELITKMKVVIKDIKESLK